jgi:hypothetical protein
MNERISQHTTDLNGRAHVVAFEICDIVRVCVITIILI